MTAICGGGSSGPKPIADVAMTYSAGRLAQLLVAAGLSEFSAALPLVGLIPVITSAFCSTDPPTMTALTSDEANAVLNLTFGSDLSNGLGKLKDILLNLVWLDICQCTSGGLTPPTPPTTPSGAPVFVPPSNAPGPFQAQGWYPMLRADAKVLALGCGSPARPTGYLNPTFDDSAWATPVNPSGSSGTWAANQKAAFNARGDALGSNASLPGNIEWVAPASPIAHNCEQFLVRWKVFLPAITPAQAIFRIASFNQAGSGGWSTGSVGINGRSGNAFNSLTGTAIMSFLLPGQWNVITADVNSGNTGSANTWGTEGGIGMGLDFTAAPIVQNVTPCCPPDVTTQAYLDLILQAVTLTQRQAAPFGYVPGTVHAGLTGAGTIDIQGVLGAMIEVTTLPSRAGSEGSGPTEYFDLGWVSFGTPDGWPTSYRIDKQKTLCIPRAAGLYTQIDYDVPDDVVVTIRELVREP